MGLRLITALAVGGGCFWLYARHQPTNMLLGATAVAGFVGYMLPLYWLRGRAKRRQKEIRRALPDALDMLTIAVEAGLAFESGLLRVGEQWHNALSEEFRRVVGEMRMGVTRAAALERMVARTDVEELATFVAVLVQSSQLGVSIAQVLQTQAAQMRDRRRQRAEETGAAGQRQNCPGAGRLLFPGVVYRAAGTDRAAVYGRPERNARR